MNGPPFASSSKTCRSLSTAGYGRKHARCATPDIVFPSSARKARGFQKSRETLEGIEIYRHWLWEASGPLGYLLEYSWALTAQFLLALRVYARTRFRILQACNPPDTIFLIGLFFKLFGVRFIFDHHDLNPELYEAKFQRRGLGYKLVCWAERLTFRTANVSIATNESYREVAHDSRRHEPRAHFRGAELPGPGQNPNTPPATRAQGRPPPSGGVSRRHGLIRMGWICCSSRLPFVAKLRKLRRHAVCPDRRRARTPAA